MKTDLAIMCSMLYWLRAGMAQLILQELRKNVDKWIKKLKHKARFEPTPFCSTHCRSPKVGVASLFPRFHRQTLETNAANNHWQSPETITLLTIGNPSPNTPQPLPSILYSYCIATTILHNMSLQNYRTVHVFLFIYTTIRYYSSNSQYR